MERADNLTAVREDRPPGTKQALMDARTGRDFAAVEQLGNEILEKREDIRVRLGLARLLGELGRTKHALDHWTRLRDQGAHSFEAVYHIAKTAIEEGIPQEVAVMNTCSGGSASLRRNLSEVLREDKDSGDCDEIRHIALCGTSYCGSTLLDRMLGSLPGVRSIGESHWLIKAHYEHGYDLADFASETTPKLVACSECGVGCRVLSARFRRQLAANHNKWYFRIARALGTRTLVSADKNVPKLLDNDPLLRLDALVVFKSPAQAWASTLDKLPRDKEPDFYASECIKYMKIWSESYKSLLDQFSPSGKVVFLNFDVFAEKPKILFEQLCGALSLPFDPSASQRVTPGHAIGGNSKALARLRMNDYRVDILPLPTPTIPVEQIRLVESHDAATHIYSRLMSAFASTMAGSPS
jgi:hypothetical protein